MLTTFHFLHLVTAIAWAGGTILTSLSFFPVLARMDHATAAATWARLAPAIGKTLGISGGLTMLTGLVRARAGGGITSLADLGSAYGLIVIAALVIVAADGAFGARQRKAIEAVLADPQRYAAEGPARLRAAAWPGLITTAVLIILMTMLGLGLY